MIASRRIALLLSGVLAGGCARASERVADEGEFVGEAREAAPERSASEPRHSWVGVVVARASIDVASPVGGKLEELPYAVGQRVVAGDVLARLSNVDLVHQLRLARSATSSARSDVRRSRHERDRAERRRALTERLGDHVSGEERSDAAFEVKRSEAVVGSIVGELGERQAEAARLHALVDALTVRADFAGVVAIHYESPGQILAPESPIVRLISEETLLRFAIPHAEAKAVEIGTRVVFDPDGDGEPVTGRVQAVAPEVDAASMILVEAALDVPGALPAGVSGRVETVP